MRKVFRVSELTGKLAVWELDVTQEQLDEIALPQHQRRLIQDIVPHLDNEQREFLKTGITPKEWAALFKEEQ